MSLEYLEGKSFPELICELPEIKWKYNGDKGPQSGVKIKELNFIDFYKGNDKLKRKEYETFASMDVSGDLSEDELKSVFKKCDEVEERVRGITSKVQLGKPFDIESDIYQSEKKFAHIPMLDFDFDKRDEWEINTMDGDELMDLVYRTGERTELDEGAILKSSDRNYHLIGLGELFDEDKLVDFIGYALTTIQKRDECDSNFWKVLRNGDFRDWVNYAYSQFGSKDKNDIIVPDAGHLGYSLIPMAHIPNIENENYPEKDWSKYDYSDKFITLRMGPKACSDDRKEYEVIEVFE